jgi:hypothetical protein
MRLLEGDEFVRGILEPAGLALAEVQEMSAHQGTLQSFLSIAPNLRVWLRQQPSLQASDQAIGCGPHSATPDNRASHYLLLTEPSCMDFMPQTHLGAIHNAAAGRHCLVEIQWSTPRALSPMHAS